MAILNRVVVFRSELTRNHVQVQRFTKFIEFFVELFSRTAALEGLECRSNFKEYVLDYYRDYFAERIRPLNHKHVKWLRRMELVLRLPVGSRIIDFGGGFGLDSILLASQGYKVVFCEISNNHLAVARFLKNAWEQRFGPIPLTILRADLPETRTIEPADAILFDEVAHHIEPAEHSFLTAAKMVRAGGHLFLLEPNFFSPSVQLFFFRSRGFKTVGTRIDDTTGEKLVYGNEHIRPLFVWRSIGSKCGFQLLEAHYVVPWFLRNKESLSSRWRLFLECTPGLRNILASHVTSHYVSCKPV